MFCSICGCEIKETDKVCLACGQPNENYVAPEGAEAEVVAQAEAVEAAAEEAVEAAVATEAAEAVVEKVEDAAEEAGEVVKAAPASKKDLVKPIVALALAGVAFFSFASGLIPLIMSIVARFLAKPYKGVTEKPVSIFYKVTNIVSLVTIILSAVATAIGVIAVIFSLIGSLISGATFIGLAGLGGGMYLFDFDLFDIIIEILEEIFDAIGLI